MTGGRKKGNTKGLTREGLQAAVIQLAEVTEVQPDTWTMSARTMVGGRTVRNMTIPSLYTHRFSGAGVHVLPEVGAMFWMAIPSEGDARPFALNYVPPPDATGANRGHRPILTPGDVELSTRDGNAVRVRRGGVVEIEAHPTCRTIYLPSRGEVLTIAENYRLALLGGSLDWLTGDKDEAFGGEDTLTTFELEVKNRAEDPFGGVRMAMGGGGGFALGVFESGDVASAAERAVGALLVMDDDGDIRIEMKAGGDVRIYDTGTGNDQLVKGVVLGPTFMTDLAQFLTELQSALSAFGIVLPGLATLMANALASSAVGSMGGAPYISTRTRTQ